MENKNTVAVRVDAKAVTIPNVQAMLRHDEQKSYVPLKNGVACVGENVPLAWPAVLLLPG